MERGHPVNRFLFSANKEFTGVGRVPARIDVEAAVYDSLSIEQQIVVEVQVEVDANEPCSCLIKKQDIKSAPVSPLFETVFLQLYFMSSTKLFVLVSL